MCKQRRDKNNSSSSQTRKGLSSKGYLFSNNYDVWMSLHIQVLQVKLHKTPYIRTTLDACEANSNPNCSPTLQQHFRAKKGIQTLLLVCQVLPQTSAKMSNFCCNTYFNSCRGYDQTKVYPLANFMIKLHLLSFSQVPDRNIQPLFWIFWLPYVAIHFGDFFFFFFFFGFLFPPLCR